MSLFCFNPLTSSLSTTFSLDSTTSSFTPSVLHSRLDLFLGLFSATLFFLLSSNPPLCSSLFSSALFFVRASPTERRDDEMDTLNLEEIEESTAEVEGLNLLGFRTGPSISEPKREITRRQI